MKYGIIFKRPADEKRSWSIESDKNDWWINIECVFTEHNSHNENKTFNPDETLELLNKHWNSDTKLMKLQSHGTIYDLGTGFSNTKTELTEFKKNHKNVKMLVSDSLATIGDIDYVAKDNDQLYLDAVLEVPMFMFESIESGIIDAEEYDWEYIFIFDKETKKFEYRKVI
jgi:hypothetical protein